MLEKMELKRIWNKICYGLSDIRKLTEIEVEFELITDSGYTISTITNKYPAKKLIFFDGGYQARWDKEKELSKKNEDLFNKRAKEILKKHYRKGKSLLKQGIHYNGKFIVKCLWEVNIKSVRPTFKEYLKYLKQKRKKCKKET